MIIVTDTLIAIRCPECGKLEYYKLSRFEFSGKKRIELECSCGYLKLILTTKDRKHYWLQVPCVVCESKHVSSLSAKMLWSDAVKYLYCHETGLELGYIGPCDEVKALAVAQQETMEALGDFSSDDEYFVNSEIMYEVLNCLHDIAEQGLLFCQCGNQDVEVDIFPDRLELHCKDCDSVNIIYAETDDDLLVIKEVASIELTRNGFECLDSLSNTTKTSRKPSRKHK